MGIGDALGKIHDTLRPFCSKCGKRVFVFSDRAGELVRLRELGEYRQEYDQWSRLCPSCWTRISTVRCDICQRKFNLIENPDYCEQLDRNLKAHQVILPEVNQAKRICKTCFTQRFHCFCARCSAGFPESENRAEKYKLDDDLLRQLAPYHKDYSTTWKQLCSSCYQDCLTSGNDVRARLRQWVGGAKGEHIRNYRTIKSLGRVEYQGTECSEPAWVEEFLKRYSVQLGGNAFVKYYWDKHSERVIEGYGPRGNPYYKTRNWFTGYATAVFVEPFRTPSRTADEDRSLVRKNQQVQSVVIDGLNVCYWSGAEKREPELTIVLTICVELARRHIPFFVFFDANTPHRLREAGDNTSPDVYKRLLDSWSTLFSEVPGRIKADEFILQKAHGDNAFIVSNDQYRNYVDAYPWVVSDDRLIKDTVAGDRVFIPTLGVDSVVIKAVENAYLAFETMMSERS
jgi:hypothetical protein